MPDQVEVERARQLASLVRPYFPLSVPTRSVDDSWSLSGPALIARQTGTLEAIVQLRPIRRFADEIILARSLFDHATTFAWLAADPSTDRDRRFARSDACARLSIDDDCQKYGGPILKDEMRAWHEGNRDALEKNMPDLAQRAEQADADWMGRLPLMDDGPNGATYRKLYAHMYRHHSGYEHPSALGLLAVAEDQPDESTHVSIEPLIDFEVLYLSNVLYTRSLYIASLTMGWPDADEVTAVWG